MNRKLVLEAVAHQPPAHATSRPDGLSELEFDLVSVFHHGYIEVHSRPPKAGTNPLFDEYTNLLADGTDYLRWESPGFARGDHKGSESHRLGRIFARAYLSMFGYRWFPNIKDLMDAPERGWSAERPQEGDMPDWLVGGGQQVAVAEAKGTHSAVGAGSSVLAKHWRPQLANVRVLRDRTPVKVKGWIVATRWVSTDQPKTEPKMYAEDPEVPGARELGTNDVPSVLTWLARTHTLRNLMRLGQHRAAQRVASPSRLRASVPPAHPLTWRCRAPGLQHLAFVGRMVGGPQAPAFPFAPWRFWREFMPIPHAEWERWEQLWQAQRDAELDEAWFDGVAVPTVTSLIRDEEPPTLEQMEVEPALRPGVSLLGDGSLIAPASLMKPGDRVEI